MKKPLPKRQQKLPRLNDPRIMVGGMIVMLAIVGLLFHVLYKPKVESPAEVFAEVQQKKDAVQVSLFSITGVKQNRLAGTGHVRYNKNGQIFRYGDGKFGANITLVFEDMASEGYKSCAELIVKPIPFNKEIFIAANGVAGSGGVPNPATGQPLNPGLVTFTEVKSCYYAARLN